MRENNFNFLIQTHLFIGENKFLVNYTKDLLKNIFANNSFENVLWLTPEKQYNLEQIDIIQNKISFSLDQNQKYFIILEQADLLTTACSNRLLKSIEEPPANYYFIFLTQRSKQILPTIYSRCMITKVASLQTLEQYQINLSINLNNSDIGKFFVTKNCDPIEFLKVIEKSYINEHESLELIDMLINYWSINYKKALINKNNSELNNCESKLQILNNSIDLPIMPGSSKIFWKNLFINFNAAKY